MPSRIIITVNTNVAGAGPERILLLDQKELSFLCVSTNYLTSKLLNIYTIERTKHISEGFYEN